jgi:alpha-2-macroglobulin
MKNRKNSKTILFLYIIISFLVVNCKSTTKYPKGDNFKVSSKKKRIDPFTGLEIMVENKEDLKFKIYSGPKPPAQIMEKMSIFPVPKKPVISKKIIGDLKVLRVHPKGKVRNIKALTVTFNQPMIKLSSIEDEKKVKIPISVDPQHKGKFIWLGTRVLSFEPERRFPYSTNYVVKIPAGIKSALGGELKEVKQFSFSTPLLEITSSIPYNSSQNNILETGVVLFFNQDINENDVFKTLIFEDGKRKKLEIRLISQKNWSKDKQWGKTSKHWNKKRTIFVRPVKKLRKNTNYSLTLKEGAKSAEGPLLTQKNQSRYFKTFGPFFTISSGCNYYGKPCRPGWTPYIRLSNGIKTENKDLKKYIKITPAPKGLKLSGSYSYIYVYGDFKPSKTYKVRIKPGLVDIYGQRMNKKFKGKIKFLDAYPNFRFPTYNKFAVMEKKLGAKFYIKGTNLLKKAKITMVKIDDNNFLEAMHAVRGYYYSYKKVKPSEKIKGKRIEFSKRLNTKKNIEQNISINLNKILKGKGGTLFLQIYIPEFDKSKYSNPYRFIVINVTDLGVTVKYDIDKIIYMVTGLSSGKTINEAALTLYKRPDKTSKNLVKIWSGDTDKLGMRRSDGIKKFGFPGPYILKVKYRKDEVFLEIDGSGSGYVSSYGKYATSLPTKRGLIYYMFTDRNPYKAGETVNLTGVVRSESYEKNGSTEALKGKDIKLEYSITDPRGNKVVVKKVVKVDKDGVFSVKFKSKKDASLGYYNFYGKVINAENIGKSNSIYKAFQILAFRTPQYFVKVKSEPGPYFYNDLLKGDISGQYSFGGPMVDSKITWLLKRNNAHFTPPNHSGFSFGIHRDWWNYRRGYGYSWYSSSIKNGKGKLDKDGLHKFSVKLKPSTDKINKLLPSTFVLEGHVYDVNRQSISGRKSVLVHPASVYVGLKLPLSIIKEKTPGKIQVVVADIEGKRVKGKKIIIKAIKNYYETTRVKNGKYWTTKYVWKTKIVGNCEVISDISVKSCEITYKKPGYYKITAETTDKKGRIAISQTGIYVYGKSYTPWNLKNKKRVDIVTDKKLYKPGETAKILIKSPFKSSVGILSIERNGILKHKRVELQGSTYIYDLKIKPEYLPNVYISVALVRGRIKAKKGDTTDAGRPLYATAQKSIKISLESKKLNIKVKPSRKILKPGETISINVNVKNYRGKGVKSRLAIMVVDEAVLSLMGFSTPNPLASFHRNKSSRTALEDVRNYLLKKFKKIKRPKKSPPKNRRRPRTSNGHRKDYKKSGSLSTLSLNGASADKSAESEAAPSPGAKKRSGSKFQVRKLFATNAYFNNSLTTNNNGELSVKIKMPQNLTTYRIMVVALEKNVKDRYGSGENQIKIRQKFMIRPSLPRFSNYGDMFYASVVVNNLTKVKRKAEVSIEGIGFTLLDKKVKSVMIEPNKSKEILFKVKTTRPGRIRFRFSGKMGDETDAVEPPPIPCYIPSSTEVTATYGVTKVSSLQPIKPPKNSMSIFGGLDIHISSTALTGLQDAVKHLIDYPYYSTDAEASRLLPIFTLKDIITHFKLAKVSKIEKQKQIVSVSLRRIIKAQKWDGGFSYWPGYWRTNPYVTAYVTWVLLRGREAGFKIPEKVLIKAAGYLRTFVRNKYKWRWGGWYYSHTIRIMCAWLLSEMVDLKFLPRSYQIKSSLLTDLKYLYKFKDNVGIFAKAWLMTALYRIEKNSDRVKELMRLIENSVIENASRIHFAEGTQEALKLIMHSNVKTDAIVLRSLMEVNPNDVMIPKIVRGLMFSRVRGEWGSTQANSFALDSMSEYYREYEKEVPDFVANFWYGNGFIGSKKFKGRSMKITHKRVPMSFLMKQGSKNLIMAKKGAGKLYYRLGLTYVPKSLILKPLDRGFLVKRSYEAIQDKNDVVKLKNGNYRVKAGKYVRVKMTIVVSSRKYYVAVDDPLPAGFEAVNMSFKTSARNMLSGKSKSSSSHHFRWWYYFRSPDHKEMRDERYVMFWTRLPAGTYVQSYIARSTTLGKFVVPPLKVHEMYTPEVFGRNGTTIVEVVK